MSAASETVGVADTMEQCVTIQSMLLGEIQCVLSSLRQRFGFGAALGSWEENNAKTQEGNRLQMGLVDSVSSLKELRSRVLSAKLPELHFREIMLPFLSIIQKETWITIALLRSLEAILRILSYWAPSTIASDSHSDASDSLTEVVESLIQCKTHIIDQEQAEKALIFIIQILGKVAESSQSGNSLSDHAMWQLVLILYDLAQATGGNISSSNCVSSLASKGLLDAFEYLFQNPLIYATTSSKGFGLPCAVKVFGFLIEKLNQPSLGHISRGELHLCLKLLHHILSVCDANQFMQTPSMMLFINDDLCKMLLINGRLDARLGVKTCLLCLKIVRVLWIRMRWILKIQLEAILNGVFGRTLNWILSHLYRHAAETADTSQDHSVAEVQDRIREILGSEMEHLHGSLHDIEDSKSSLYFVSYEITQCLVDLLADPSILSDLYVNYDCDNAHCDVLHHLIELLALIVQQSHRACRFSFNHRRILWIQAIQELAMEGLFNVVYALDRRNKPSERLSLSKSASLREKKERKRQYQNGVVEFNRKPIHGIRNLQTSGFLPSPLEPHDMALFLRSLPQGMDKKTVGMYLGAKGKDLNAFEKEDIHEADTVSFHQDVLHQYVASFDFDGECILDALRMFLASFRLPGEAQQIDRILNTFAYAVYQQCRDRCLMASPDVAYLLSFSLIMLNTDLHNPNILPEKKMSCQCFVRNNTNYGEEVSQAQDLPPDFLTSLFQSIATNEIQTLDECGIHGEILTEDRWKDLMKQIKATKDQCNMIVHHSMHHASLGSMKEGEDRDNAESLHRDGQYDHDISKMILNDTANAFASIFDLYVDKINQSDTTNQDRSVGKLPNTSITSAAFYEPGKKMLQMACNGLVSCSSLAGNLGFIDLFNTLLLRLLQYTFLLPSSDLYRYSAYDFSDPRLEFCSNPSALLATAGVLRLVHTCGATGVSLQTWRGFCHILCALRDLQALPPAFYRKLSIKDENSEKNASKWWLSDEEMDDFLARTSEILEWSKKQREQTSLISQTPTSFPSFFGGMAWLFSAFDSTEKAVTSSSVETDSLQCHLEASRQSSNVDDRIQSALELESTATLIDRERPTELESEAVVGTLHSLGSAQWLQETLQPYHLDTLLDHLVSFPCVILQELVQAMQIEVLRGITESNKATIASEENQLPLLDIENIVFLQRIVSWLTVNASRRLIAETKSFDEEKDLPQIWPTLYHHMTQVVEALRSSLCQDTTASQIPYTLAAMLLQRVLEGLFGCVAQLSNELNDILRTLWMDLILEIACKLLEMEFVVTETGSSHSIDSQYAVIDPFTTQLVRGFRFLLEGRNDSASSLKFRNTVLELSKKSIQQRFACRHAFHLVHHMVRETKENPIAAADGVNEILLTDYFTITLQMALGPAKENWISLNGNTELPLVFESLESMVSQCTQTGTIEVDESMRMLTAERFLGGMLLIVEYHWDVVSATRDVHRAGEWFDAALRAFQWSVRGIHTETFSANAWINVLECGLLPFGTSVLSSKCKSNGSNSTLFERKTKNGNPFLYFYELLGFKEKVVASSPMNDRFRRHSLSSATTPNHTQVSGRTRRSCSILESSMLDPMTAVVEMMTQIICAHLEKLVMAESFLPIWERIVEFLLQVLLYTRAANGAEQNGRSKVSTISPNSSVEVITKLIVERRDILTAHEMVTEHIQCLLRRMSSDEENVSSDIHRRMSSLSEVWECKCKENAVYYQLLMDLVSIDENGGGEARESGASG
ncbi:unnamed protein product [Albugo candida]|uniref:SEC7 domain-containing protein n=1 Tax=Albugo candida TaxID=65357 RepID=A0A024GCC9_9STRA|nr:unnamed protein product [Albugo candida]|eukprot:CCI44205.1 unnamed protein product [Albugo candida]